MRRGLLFVERELERELESELESELMRKLAHRRARAVVIDLAARDSICESAVTFPTKSAQAPRKPSRSIAPRWLLSILITARLLVAARAAQADEDPWFGPDKALHFTLSAAIAGGGYAIAVPLTQGVDDPRRWRLAAGAGLAIAAGAGKEISDRYDGGDASWRDFTWDLIGTATGVGIAWLIDHLVNGRSHPHVAQQPPGP